MRRGGCALIAAAVAVEIEMTSPPVHQPAHQRQPVVPHRHANLGGLVGQPASHGQLARAVVDDHRQPQGHGRETLGLALGQAAQGGRLDHHRHVAQFERANLEGVEASQLEATQPDLADAGAERVGDGTHPGRRGSAA
jgi:hypothetical protein